MAHTGWPSSAGSVSPEPKALAEAMMAQIAKAKAGGASKPKAKAEAAAEGTAKAAAKRPAAKEAARLRPADEEEEEEEEEEWDEDSEEEEEEEEEDWDEERGAQSGASGEGSPPPKPKAEAKGKANAAAKGKADATPPPKKPKLQHEGAVPPRPSMPIGDEEVHYRGARLLLHINTRGENTWRVFIPAMVGLYGKMRESVDKLRQFGTKANPPTEEKKKAAWEKALDLVDETLKE